MPQAATHHIAVLSRLGYIVVPHVSHFMQVPFHHSSKVVEKAVSPWCLGVCPEKYLICAKRT